MMNGSIHKAINNIFEPKSTMKKLFILLTLSFIVVLNAIAQVKEGIITFERKINMHKRIQDEQMKAMMPEFRVSKHLLLFSDSTSIYKAIPEDESPDPFEGGNGGGMRMAFKMPGDGGEIYKNYATGLLVEQTEIFSKTFIINDSIKKQAWKLTGETQKVLGHNCFKATTKQTMKVAGGMFRRRNNEPDSAEGKAPELKDVVMEVTAWFAEDIISPVGPENNGGLPGAILMLDINNGETLFTATEIKPTVNKKEIKQPTKGKKVTREEFRNTVKEMMQNFGPPGGGRRRDD